MSKILTKIRTACDKLQDVMKAHKVSQAEIAERAGISQPALSKMLNKDIPRIDSFLRVIHYLNEILEERGEDKNYTIKDFF